MGLVRHFREYWGAWQRQPRERAKLVLGCIFFPRATGQWLSYLSSHAPLRTLAREYPQLATRIYRPYALRHLNCRERVAHMIAHHDLLRRSEWASLAHLSLSQVVDIIEWTTPAGDTLHLQLMSLQDGHREGELTLRLLWNETTLFSLTFLIRKQAGTPQLLVTRFQGSSSEAAPALIRQATKALHGLRPADLLIQLAQHLGHILGCEAVTLVSNRHRVSLNPRRRRRIKVDLDKIWLERGAQKTPDGLFVLPAAVTVRTDFSDVASNKRAQAKRKAETLQQVLQAFEDQLHAWRMRAPA